MKANGISSDETRVIRDAVVRFCRHEGAVCYRAFSDEVLQDYVDFHFQHETLAWVRHGGPHPGEWRITGVGVAWQCDPEDIFQAHCQTRHPFSWRPTNPQGRAIFIADVVATAPRALLALVQTFTQRFPDWAQRGLYTYRRGKLIYLTPRRLVRLYRRTFKTVTVTNNQQQHSTQD